MVAPVLAQVRLAGGNTAEQIAHACDRSYLRLGIEILFQRCAHDFARAG